MRSMLFSLKFYISVSLVLIFGIVIGFYIARAADGEVLSYQKISDTEGGFTATLLDSESIGDDVANIGDVNNDGVTDIAVGSRNDSDGGSSRGAIYIIFLNSNGTASSYQKISDTAGGFTATLDDGDAFGWSVDGIGDVNNDGIPDVVVGAQSDDDGGTDRGALYIIFLNSNGTASSYQKISDTAGEFTATIDDSDFFGRSVAGIGDLNGDSVPDIVVGAPGDDDGASGRGALYVIFLDTNGTVNDIAGYQKISDTEGEFTADLSTGSIGSGVALIGDINNDGVPDIATTVPDYGNVEGGFYVLFMDANGTVSGDGYVLIAEGLAGFSATIEDLVNLGYANSVDGIGDVNGDGVPDIALGARWDNDGGGAFSFRGAVYILFMASNGSVASYQKISDTAGNFTATLENSDEFGYSLAGIGDLNGDGVSDIIVGTPGDDDGGSNRGAVYTLFLDGADASAPTAGGGGTISATPSFFTMDLSWTAATDNVTAANDLVYKVYRASAGADLDSVLDIEANGTLVSTQTGGDVTYTLIDLQPNTVYTFNVIVSDEADNKTAYTQGSAQTLYPSQAPITYIERPYFNIRGDDCSWDRNIILEIGGKNIDTVVVADNGQFLGAAWQPFRANTVINTSGGPTKVMEIHKQLPRDYGTYTYFAIVKSVTGNQSRTMIDAITLTSRAGCTYPTRQRIPYFGKSDTDIAAYQDAIDKAMDLEEELAHEKALQEEADKNNPLFIEGVKEGDLVKANDGSSSLYYVSQSLTRHAFLNEQIFATWYNPSDMKRAKLVSQTTMDRLPLKGPMPPKPHSTLVTFQNDTTVYLPATNLNAKPNTIPYNILLRPITTSGLTEELYGQDYQTLLLTLPESAKPHFTISNAITKFDLSLAKLKQTMKRW